MTARSSLTQLYSGKVVSSLYGGHGITGTELRALPTGPSGQALLYNDWDSGDDAVEFRLRLDEAPASGTLTVYEDSSFKLVGAAVGNWTLKYTPFYDGVAGAQTTSTIQVGLITASKDLAFSYAVLNKSTKDQTISYVVLGKSTLDLPISYTILGTATKDLSLAYAVLNKAQKDLTISYDILNAGTSVKDLAISYTVLNKAQKDLSLAFTVLNSYSKDLAISYDVASSLVTATKDLAFSYRVLNTYTKNLGLSWQVGDGGVARPASVTYNLGAVVRTVLVPQAYNVLPTVPFSPGDVSDILFDWAAWLGTDTLDTIQVTLGPNLLKVAEEQLASGVRVWLEMDSQLPYGSISRVVCKVQTVGAPGRTAVRTLNLVASTA